MRFRLGLSLSLSLFAIASHTATAAVIEEESMRIQRSSALTASEDLASLSDESRHNARIRLYLYDEDIGAESTARAVEAEWAAGQHDAAIAKIYELERRGVALSVGTSWLSPIVGTTPPTAGSNALITSDVNGEPVIGIDIDRDPQTGNLFAIVRAASGWALFLSSNQGAAWTETYSLLFGNLGDVDAVVVDGFYYTVTVVPKFLVTHRFSLTTGAADQSYTVAISSPPVDELGAVSNRSGDNNRLYIFALQENGCILHYWTATDLGATSFDEQSVGVCNAESGLSVAYDPAGSLFAPFLYVTYRVNTQLRLVKGSVLGWGAFAVITGAGTATGNHSSVSVHGSTIIVGYDRPVAGLDVASYRISYDDGGSWTGSNLGGAGSRVPRVSADSGTGIAAVYAQEGGPFDPLYFIEHHGYSNTTIYPWPNLGAINDYSVSTGSRVGDLAWMGHGWGVAYLSNDPITFSTAAWFSWSPSIRYSGFETGDTSEWSLAVP
jgi:hypothetical protein